MNSRPPAACAALPQADLLNGSSLVHCWQKRVTRPEASVMAIARKWSSAAGQQMQHAAWAV
jgi:hypothetical protein